METHEQQHIKAAKGPVGADRVLVALKLLAERSGAVSLEQFALELNAPKSTTHRVLAKLARAGFVDRDGQARYMLSSEFIRLAYRHHESRDHWSEIQVTLRALTDRFGETSYAGRLDGGDVVYVAMSTAPGTLHTATVLGARNPAYRTGLGKALLAASLPDQQAVARHVTKHGPLDAVTPKTITTADELEAELRATRARGFAIDDEENEAGVVCIGLPVYLDSGSSPSVAISVAAIKLRTPLDVLVKRADEARIIIESQFGRGATSPG